MYHWAHQIRPLPQIFSVLTTIKWFHTTDSSEVLWTVVRAGNSTPQNSDNRGGGVTAGGIALPATSRRSVGPPLKLPLLWFGSRNKGLDHEYLIQYETWRHPSLSLMSVTKWPLKFSYLLVFWPECLTNRASDYTQPLGVKRVEGILFLAKEKGEERWSGTQGTVWPNADLTLPLSRWSHVSKTTIQDFWFQLRPVN